MRVFKRVLRGVRRLTKLFIFLGILGILSLFLLRGYSAVRAVGYIYTLETVPERPVAIIFGAGLTYSGTPTAMLADRVLMGVELYQAGKVEMLLMTGDNHIANYNEPESMRQYAIDRGVPESAIVLDYAGFRTYDSCYRAREVFQLDEVILVTQAFHLDRALLTCGSLGLDVVGVPVDDVRPTDYSRRSLLSSQLRELPSTAAAVFDLVIGREPRYLGEPIPIFER